MMNSQIYKFDHDAERSKANILVVDDDPAIVRLVQHFLDCQFGESIRQFHATNAMHAQSIVENNLIDLVITDLEMGKPDGFQLLRWIKEWEPLIRTVVITGHDTHDALRSALSLGACDFITKPLQFAPLMQSVETLLERLQSWQSLLSKTTHDGPLFGVLPMPR